MCFHAVFLSWTRSGFAPFLMSPVHRKKNSIAITSRETCVVGEGEFNDADSSRVLLKKKRKKYSLCVTDG